MSKLTMVRGFNDVLPLDSYKWQFLESKVKLLLDRYNSSDTRLRRV
ncbi:histidine--tRNA ligase, partial [Francisella tularensis subsp. holarctica]|nr:histidine--tRNA ligase [Francisella tularensis subsp. holarctica]